MASSPLLKSGAVTGLRVQLFAPSSIARGLIDGHFRPKEVHVSASLTEQSKLYGLREGHLSSKEVFILVRIQVELPCLVV